ncbi:MAG: MGH1-like glycoside hydrolase domain-containing protein, partial [Aristaeellaceae bacterium]
MTRQDCRPLEAYVQEHVEALLKQPRSFIHYPFIDPGSVYDGNVWDWDTFWSVYGLFSVSELFPEALNQRILLHAEGNVRNFIDHQQPDGYIPMMIEVAQWPEPYLVMKHKEGVRMNMHKPFLASQIALISRKKQDWEWARAFVEPLERYFACYQTYFNDNCGLYVWHDDIMIGMDNDPATFGRPHDATANIFLNSFMVMELQAMADLLNALGLPCDMYTARRQALIEAIQRECWDPRDKFFYSVDVDIKTRRYDWFHQGLGVFWKTLPIKVRVWSGFLPMLAGFATPEQAEALARHAFDEATFASPYGVCTLAKDERMFDLSATNNPSNWLGPIWLVANYAVFKGLMNYGYRAEAEK